MFSIIRRRLTFTNVALILVLVLAMTGGAYAAKKYVITSTKQISPAVLKQLQGKTGSAGAPGAQGSVGQAGTNGTNGTSGKDGANGKNGAQGGAGPAGSTGAAGPAGTTGATGTPGIPGKTGPTGPVGTTGPEGSPWTAGGTLPKEKTETGTWAIAEGKPAKVLGGFGAETSISFPIPLNEALDEAHVHIILAGAKGAGGGTCPTASEAAKPEAEPGNLCVFITLGENIDESEGGIALISLEVLSLGAGKTGSLLNVKTPEEKENESMKAFGTWAVTAP